MSFVIKASNNLMKMRLSIKIHVLSVSCLRCKGVIILNLFVFLSIWLYFSEYLYSMLIVAVHCCDGQMVLVLTCLSYWFVFIAQEFILSTLEKHGKSFYWLPELLLQLRTPRIWLFNLRGPMVKELSSSLPSTLVLMQLLEGIPLVPSLTRCRLHSVNLVSWSSLIQGLIIRWTQTCQ
jgi:hypothetical protein